MYLLTGFCRPKGVYMVDESNAADQGAAETKAILDNRQLILAAGRQQRAKEDAIRSGFEGRLHGRYRHPLELFDTIYLAINNRVKVFTEAHLPEANGKQDAAFVVQLQLCARAYLTTVEIRTLLRAGLATGALARWRTMYELIIIGQFVVDRSPTAAERYYFHDRIQAMELIERGIEANGNIDGNTAEKFRKMRGELEGKYGSEIVNRYGWASPYFLDRKTGAPKQKPTFNDIEGKVLEDEKYKRMFKLVKIFYQAASNANHATSHGNSFNIQNPVSDNRVVAGPSMAGLGTPATLALKSLLHSASLFISTRSAPELTPFLAAVQQLINEMSESFDAIEGIGKASGFKWGD